MNKYAMSFTKRLFENISSFFPFPENERKFQGAENRGLNVNKLSNLNDGSHQ